MFFDYNNGLTKGDAMSNSRRVLESEATKMLRDNGYTWSGRVRGNVDPRQCRFDKRIILTPSKCR